MNKEYLIAGNSEYVDFVREHLTNLNVPKENIRSCTTVEDLAKSLDDFEKGIVIMDSVLSSQIPGKRANAYPFAIYAKIKGNRVAVYSSDYELSEQDKTGLNQKSIHVLRKERAHKCTYEFCSDVLDKKPEHISMSDAAGN